MLAKSIGEYLQGKGIVTNTNYYIDFLPPSPDDATGIFSSGGYPVDGKEGYDEPTIQVVSRARLSENAYTKSAQIYSELHGLNTVTLADGTHIVNCLGMQSSPQNLGRDVDGRTEYVVNYRFRVRNKTVHRV